MRRAWRPGRSWRTRDDRVAAALGVRPREVMFCSGASEAIATVGHASIGHHVLAAVEHSAVRSWAARRPHTIVGVDGVGRVDPADLLDAARADTSIVHLQWANHEVGTIQPVAEVVERCRERRLPVHVDAAQAVGHLPTDLGALGADYVSISGHKFGGPSGSGALVIRRGVRPTPLIVGGDQERARRAGMESVVTIAGFAAALDEAVAALSTDGERERNLTRPVIDWAVDTPGISVLGDPSDRAPHLVCLAIEGLEPQPVLIGLDRAGVAVHSGNSCSSEALEPSPVLAAMGVDAHRSLRISMGWSTTPDDVTTMLGALTGVLDELRSLRT
ncbi:MAG: aminotransferase class V-fold PLP-dependent enzyme [Microthrixaceae bacterium]